MEKKRHFHNGQMGSAITVRISPRSSRNEISEIMTDGVIKIHLTAPPVEGQANKALIKFLASILGVPPTNIEIITGQKSRDKLVTIIGLDTEEVKDRLMAHLTS